MLSSTMLVTFVLLKTSKSTDSTAESGMEFGGELAGGGLGTYRATGVSWDRLFLLIVWMADVHILVDDRVAEIDAT